MTAIISPPTKPMASTTRRFVRAIDLCEERTIRGRTDNSVAHSGSLSTIAATAPNAKSDTEPMSRVSAG